MRTDATASAARARTAVVAALACFAIVIAAPAQAHAEFGVTEPNWEAGTCEARECTYASPTKDFFTQAAGHPEWGITSFELNHNGEGIPDGQLKRIRVDVPEGLAANPQAPTPACAKATFETDPTLCPPASVVGETELNAVAEPPALPPLHLEKQKGTVYNLQLEPGLPLLFGIAVEPTGGVLVSPVHLLLEGHVSFATEPALTARGIPSGDYHEWFEIDNVPTTAKVKVGPLEVVEAPLKTLKSKLLFKGRTGGNFLTLPSVCSSSTTSYLEVESYEGGHSSTATHTPVGVTGCDSVPFEPSLSLTPETALPDAPDGARTEVKVPQFEEPTKINTADIRDVHALLPEGLTLNPAAAPALATCSAAQIGIGTANKVECPPASKIGTVAIETDLPPGSLAGNVYLGSPSGGTLTDPPFTIYLDAESVYGVSVRLQGLVSPNPATGRLEVTFTHNPQLPFSDLVLTLTGGPRAPLANPLACGTSHTETRFAPWTGLAEWLSTTSFTIAGGGCPAAPPFTLGQSTHSSVATAGAYNSWTFNFARGEGEQFVQQLRTVLPPGLVGTIPAVTLCGEPGAAAGNCPPTSQIGTASVLAGSGSEPASFSGPVYLTGPYNGAPYGLSIPIEAASGPFDLGRVLTRVAIGIDPRSARVIATATLPTIFKGVPLRVRSISVNVNHSNFLFNPTNCELLHTESSAVSVFAATRSLSSPFQVTGCGALPFKPTFKASTSAKTSRAIGASLKVTVTQPAHQANMRSVVVQLPKQLPSRLTTLQKACLEATFAANPFSCPPQSLVGTATAHTPVLPNALSGPAFLVSHGGAAFPDLDIILEGNGVRVILEGNTNIKNGITTSTFASIPDVPVSSFTLTLPTGPHSALASFGNFCTTALKMPTTITAQSGTVIKQTTPVTVSGCGVRILHKRVKGHTLFLKVRVFGAGRLTVTGNGLRKLSRRFSRASTVTLKIKLSKRGLSKLSHHRRLKLTVHAGFAPKARAEGSSKASARVTFKR